MINLHDLRIGDRLVREKGIFSKHHGIFVGKHNGRFLVAENNIPHGVRYVTYEQFLNGQGITRVEQFKGTERERNQVIPFINSKLGTAYNLALYNCEHFANEVQTGVAKSSQVNNAVGLGLLALLAIVLRAD